MTWFVANIFCEPFHEMQSCGQVILHLSQVEGIQLFTSSNIRWSTVLEQSAVRSFDFQDGGTVAAGSLQGSLIFDHLSCGVWHAELFSSQRFDVLAKSRVRFFCSENRHMQAPSRGRITRGDCCRTHVMPS